MGNLVIGLCYRRIGSGVSSRQIHGEAFEIGERAVRQGRLVRGAQDDTGGLGLLQTLPANGAHTNTSDRRVSGPENQVPGRESKDRCRAILKNRGTRLPSRRRPYDCQHLLAQYCSSRPDETLSWVASSRFRAARQARYVCSTGDQLHCPCCLATLSFPIQAPRWRYIPNSTEPQSSSE